MGSEKWPQDGTRKSPRLNKLGKSIDTPVMQRPMTAKRKLYCSSPRENETMGENEVQVRCLQFYLSCSILLFQKNFTLYNCFQSLYAEQEDQPPTPSTYNRL